MDDKEVLEKIQSCKDCKVCMDVCDTYLATEDELKSPNGRLKIGEKIFQGGEISEDEIQGLYTCTLCGLCDLVCQMELPISELILSSKMKLVEQEKAPLGIHKKITQGIVEKNNSVGGEPEERLDWIPEEFKDEVDFEDSDSDTLLYLGCMSSFRVKESAAASFELLKRAGYDFKILRDEPCCGEYVYSSGNLDLAKKMFQENFEQFKKQGVKTLIVTCAGCFYAFNNVYPKYLEGYDLKVRHIVQIVHELVSKGKLKFKYTDKSKTLTYHDACRMGRKIKGMDVYEEPRELLNGCAQILELSKTKVDTPCCGAGSGIRGVDSALTIKIGSQILEEMKTEQIVSACPLCVFNYRYVNYKQQMDKKARYITDILLESLEK